MYLLTLAALLCRMYAQSLPEQIHLSLTGFDSQLKVTWVSWEFSKSFLVYSPILCNGSSIASAPVYIQSDSWEFFPGVYHLWKYYIHSVTLNDLDSQCTYEYTVGNEGAWSEKFQFSGRTVTKDSEETKSLTAWIFGDLGLGSAGETTSKFLQKYSKVAVHTAAFHMGDIAYDMDQVQGGIGDAYMNMIQPWAAQIPYMVGFGNHDQDRLNNTHYKNRFSMPCNEANQGTNLFYSIDLGPVHFVMVDTTPFTDSAHSLPVGELLTQRNWLVEDLRKAQENRQVVPWIVVMTHAALYCTPDWSYPHPYKTFHECLGEADEAKAYMEDILLENRVDLVMQAHVHNYERDAPIAKNLTMVDPRDTLNTYFNPAAPVYILSGNAGNRRGQNDPLPTTPANYTRALSIEVGVGQVTAYNATHLRWTQYATATEKVIDELWIIKDQM